MLTKVLPLLIMSAGVYKNSDKIKQIISYATVAGVQIEMSNICKVLKLDSLDGSLPTEDPATFARYVRENLKSQNGQGKRDYANDMWDTPYRLQLKGKIATVVSAGPDKLFETADDVKASTDLY